jgi:hypothetical protein
MGLRTDAADDMREIHEDTDDFGWAITITDPVGTSVELVGLSNDIAQAIDPDTGLLVSGRSASVSLPIQALIDAGLGMPIGESNSKARPWVVTFDDIVGVSHTFKVSQTSPDRSIGNIVCLLETYNGS